MSVIIGIDPGKTGAIALVNDSRGFKIHDIGGSVAGTIAVIRDWHKRYNVDGVVIEGVSAMPGNAIHSTITLIGIANMLEGACMMAEIPIIAKPRPADWKKAVGIVLNPPKLAAKKPKLPAEIEGETEAEFITRTEPYAIELLAYEEAVKSHRQAKARYKRGMDTVSRDRATELFPKAATMLMRCCDTDRAEALLLGHFGLLKLGVNR